MAFVLQSLISNCETRGCVHGQRAQGKSRCDCHAGASAWTSTGGRGTALAKRTTIFHLCETQDRQGRFLFNRLSLMLVFIQRLNTSSGEGKLHLKKVDGKSTRERASLLGRVTGPRQPEPWTAWYTHGCDQPFPPASPACSLCVA